MAHRVSLPSPGIGRSLLCAALSLGMLCSPANASAAAPLGHASTAATPASLSGRPSLGDPVSPLQKEQIEKILGSRRDDVAVSVHDRRTGSVFTYNGALENATGSIVKVMVLVALIERRRESGRGLSERQQAQAEQMIRFSDNDATNSLIRAAGGSSAITKLAKKLNMKSTQGRGAWGRTSTTATDQRMLIDAIVSGKVLSSADRQYVLGLMRQVTPEQRWGVGTVPKGAVAEVKNGWVPLEPRGWRVNSIGHVTGKGRDYTVAMLSYDNPSMEAGTSMLDELSGYIYRTMGQRPNAAAAALQGSFDGVVPSSDLGAGIPSWIRSPGAAYPPRLWW
ncbi:serine hydrolase [Gephyromycinifex aptenodytis]|uniref:serine hydrolase n=1 Tax=Gephyromycinifex aptenodytis TaxID=2716227 RepID=UPI001447ED79|nr:serine hydrolase [Gephyromycinifex aptenodytis]